MFLLLISIGGTIGIVYSGHVPVHSVLVAVCGDNIVPVWGLQMTPARARILPPVTPLG